MTDYENDIKEIKEILKKMQESIDKIEKVDSTTQQYSPPDYFKDYSMYDKWQSCSVPSTHATNYWEEHKCQK